MRILGSPPRMRGKQHPQSQVLCFARITPADAGKTSQINRTVMLSWDHPRGCGENERAAARRNGSSGSPPRMRGKLDTPAEETETDRITPAYAGKTASGRCRRHQSSDHPRVCGENGLSEGERQASTGSPPRMRGKLLDEFHRCAHFRITPAYAGKTAR